MKNKTEREKRIIKGSDELRVGFSPEVDQLMAELERIAVRLGTDVDDLLNVLYERRMGTYDDMLAELLAEEEG